MFTTTRGAAATAAAPSQTLWSGLDVSKASFDAASWLPLKAERLWELHELPTQRFARTRQGAMQFLAWLDAQADSSAAARVVMEATGAYSQELAQWLGELRPALGPAIVNPRSVHAYVESLALRNKTDALDARALARFGFERRPAPYEALTPVLAQLQALVRDRDDVICMRVAEENRLREPCLSRSVRRRRQRHIAQLRKETKRIELEMHRQVGRDEQLRQDVEILDSIPGVGFITAAIVLGELGDLRRFAKARQLSAFVGQSIHHHQSGTSVHRRPHMSKQGNARVRAALYMPCLSIIRGKNPLAEVYAQLLARGKVPMAAIGAIMRKLLVLMRALLISGQKFQRQYSKSCGKTCGYPLSKGRA